MKNLSCTIFVDILLLIGLVCLLCSCNTTARNSYHIDHYIDTIDNNIIVTTVVYSKYSGDVSCSTLKLNNYDK